MERRVFLDEALAQFKKALLWILLRELNRRPPNVELRGGLLFRFVCQFAELFGQRTQFFFPIK